MDPVEHVVGDVEPAPVEFVEFVAEFREYEEPPEKQGIVDDSAVKQKPAKVFERHGRHLPGRNRRFRRDAPVERIKTDHES